MDRDRQWRKRQVLMNTILKNALGEQCMVRTNSASRGGMTLLDADEDYLIFTYKNSEGLAEYVIIPTRAIHSIAFMAAKEDEWGGMQNESKD